MASIRRLQLGLIILRRPHQLNAFLCEAQLNWQVDLTQVFLFKFQNGPQKKKKKNSKRLRPGVPTNYVLFSIISFVPFVPHYHFRFSLFSVTSHCGCLIHKDMNGHKIIVEALSLTHSVKKKKYQQKISWDIFDWVEETSLAFGAHSTSSSIIIHHPSNAFYINN